MHNKLSLGTVQFGMEYGIANQQGMVSEDDLAEILQLAKENGISSLDTAIAYGQAETRLGQYNLSYFQVDSKLPSLPDNIASIYDWCRSSIESSLLRLNISALDGVLLHRPMELLGTQGTSYYKALLKLKEQNLVQKIGVSVYSADELVAIDNAGMRFDIVQVPFNILDDRLLISGWLDKLADKGIEVHARSIFLQGLLLMKRDKIPAKFERWNGIWNTWHDWLISNEQDALSICLNYVQSFEQIKKVIVGIDSPLQLKDIIQKSKSNNNCRALPKGIKTLDIDLLNPARWSFL